MAKLPEMSVQHFVPSSLEMMASVVLEMLRRSEPSMRLEAKMHQRL